MHTRDAERTKIELLAPAGSVEAMRAAIMAGCDAVYIGGSRFGARAYADNPGEDTLLSAIELAHSYGVKVYLTVNTLLRNEELEELYEYLEPYYENGLDAVIVQDLGVLDYITKQWPDLPVHASTQMTITQPEACELLPENVTRVVPARELTLSEIARLKNETGLELEVFVHGALCYCYSGQCLMSSVIGGRSGNRGRCAQPCRKRYAVSGQQGYYLSPKDQCLLAFLPELKKAGVDSLKIEGRMKRAEYTAGVTGIYRKWLNRLEDWGTKSYEQYVSKHKEEMVEDITTLAELYNRGGFCEGYLEGQKGRDMISLDRPNHTGLLLGTVTVEGNGQLGTVHYERETQAGDVVELRESVGGISRTIYEYTIGQASVGESSRHVKFKERARTKQVFAFRTKNETLLSKIREAYTEGGRVSKINGKLVAKLGEPLKLTVSLLEAETLEGESVTVLGDVVEKAAKQAATESMIEEKLRKTGDTCYQFDNICVELDDNCFLPVSKLNGLRREALEMLQAAVLSSKCRKPTEKYRLEAEETATETNEEESEARTEQIVLVQNKDQFQAAAAHSLVTTLYVDMEGNYEECTGICCEKPCFLVLPRISRGDILSRVRLVLENMTQWKPFAGVVVRTLDELQMVKRVNKKREELGLQPLAIRASENLYVMNSQAMSSLLLQGVEHVTLSLELNERELLGLENKECELVVYGQSVVMVSNQCVQKTTNGCNKGSGVLTLTDEVGASFGVRMICPFCYNLIYNGKTMSLLAFRESIFERGYAGVVYQMSFESAEETRCVLNRFAGIDSSDEKDSTKGHYRRGVQ